MNMNREVYIVGGRRIPFVKSMGSYLGITCQDLMTESLKALVKAYHLEGKVIGDVALGAVMKSPRDFNMARESVLGSGLDPRTPAYDVQRACGTSLETTLQIALKIKAGMIDSGIAGGVDTNSDIPVTLPKSFFKKTIKLKNAKSIIDKAKMAIEYRLTDLIPQFPAVKEPRTGKSMGDHCELMVQEWKISREDQDQLSYESHQKASRAYSEGFYEDLMVPHKNIKRDALLREDTTAEKLSRLRPAFDTSSQGTLTAGNSSSLTDGSSAVLLGSKEFLDKNKLVALAKFVDAEASAVDFLNGEGLLMAPTVAVANLLKRNNLTLQDFDFYEIHEAFAGQVLCTLKAWNDPSYCKKALGSDTVLGTIDRTKMNVKGGSLALGHPFGATGTRIVATLAKTLSEKKGRGLISICTAGGMGVAAIIESV